VAKDDPTQPLNFVELFLKGQYVKKEEKRYSDATAGQIVSEFTLVKQFRDATWAYYTQLVLEEAKFPEVYLHSGASPADANSWYQEHWAPGMITANDYTSWDNGCDEVFVEFMGHIMRMAGVDEGYVEAYTHERLNTRSYLGRHLPRQESGDRWTWLANTVCNAAITGASLAYPARTPAMYSGDDGAVLGDWGPTSGFHPHQWKMVPKREKGTRLTFCGFGIGGPRLTFDSRVIAHRAEYGIALGRNDPEYWQSIRDSIREAGSAADDTDLNLARAIHLEAEARRLFAL
jgi:hypothetical protein